MWLNKSVTYVSDQYNRAILPFGFPLKLHPNWEMKQTRLRLRHASFLIQFERNFRGRIGAGFPKREGHGVF